LRGPRAEELRALLRPLERLVFLPRVCWPLRERVRWERPWCISSAVSRL